MFTLIMSSRVALDAATMNWMRSAAVILLIGLLFARELAANAQGDWRRFVRFVNIAVVPLLLLFFLTVVTITLDYLSHSALK